MIQLALAILLVFSQLTSVVLGLRTTKGSPCASVCNRDSTNTTSSEIVCLDRQYNSTLKGTHFQECVDCQLRSDFFDTISGESDVTWGLHNLRYAFTSCLYGYPHQVANISSPCVVTCSSLQPALDQNIQNPSAYGFFEWCGSSAFTDVVATQCHECYNLTANQIYLGNFIEAIRYNCHFRTSDGEAFPISPSEIFTQKPLPEHTVSLTDPPKDGSGVNLPLVIAVPIVGFIVLVCALSVCCFFCIRHRRKKSKAREEREFHEQWNTMALASPGPGAWGQYPAQAPVMSPAVWGYGGYGYGPGVAYSDNNVNGGQGQGVGFAKSDFDTIQPAVAVTSTPTPGSLEQEQEQQQQQQQQQPTGNGNEGQVQAHAQTYFPPPPGAQTQPPHGS
ncbi:uncharacterized protein ASPGLDRAFT_116203 [Aspergillus glaucus CBS 516.65]|uniref:Uncharacterized protein n=1 Tax=Aspergillus glaucus CBS 516.65 TaxID=1160497 RepID=A0A1L9VZA6_ASPGL|nr:hypothetical protein ASPGLDRAFT_116203 [Aspergillus glaucus CBS 516.65]OJJ89260.1 hypothetical protein ASPGLDRAFT_116203 [Aspergillus glaucus CBS 516.65]